MCANRRQNHPGLMGTPGRRGTRCLLSGCLVPWEAASNWLPERQKWIGALIAVDPWHDFCSSPRFLSSSLPDWHLGCCTVPRFKYKSCGLGKRTPCCLQGKEAPGSPALSLACSLSLILSLSHTHTHTHSDTHTHTPSLGIYV